MFLSKRLVFVISVIFIKEATIQVIINSLCSSSMIIFLVANKPFKSNLNNFIEIFNEITFLLLLLLCYLFTDFF
jgi:hypothetical protein